MNPDDYLLENTLEDYESLEKIEYVLTEIETGERRFLTVIDIIPFVHEILDNGWASHSRCVRCDNWDCTICEENNRKVGRLSWARETIERFFN